MRNFILLLALLLTACATAGAEPERYATLDCQELSDLKRSYDQSLAQIDLFNDADINELGRTNSTRRNLTDIGQSRPHLTPGDVKYEKDLNSIRAASRLKGC